MDIERVVDRFAVLAELDSGESARWTPLAEDACAYVWARRTTDTPDDAQLRRLELLAAAYALRLYSLRGGERLSQFVAGDVRLTAAGDLAERAETLWNTLLDGNADVIKTDGFLFGRVI